MRSFPFLIILLFLALAIPSQALARLPQYKLTKIDSVGWWRPGGAVNNHSEVAGQTAAGRPFHWVNGVTTMLSSLGGDAGATNINDNSVIVGGSGIEPGSCFGPPVRWIGGNISALTNDGRFDFGLAWGINSNGTIVGAVHDTSGEDLAFIFDGTLRTVDPGVPIGSHGFEKINDNGLALMGTGYYFNGHFTDIGAAVYDINNRNQIVARRSGGGILWKEIGRASCRERV